MLFAVLLKKRGFKAIYGRPCLEAPHPGRRAKVKPPRRAGGENGDGVHGVAPHAPRAREIGARGGVQPLEHLRVKEVGEGREPGPHTYTRSLFNSRSPWNPSFSNFKAHGRGGPAIAAAMGALVEGRSQRNTSGMCMLECVDAWVRGCVPGTITAQPRVFSSVCWRQ